MDMGERGAFAVRNDPVKERQLERAAYCIWFDGEDGNTDVSVLANTRLIASPDF